MGKHLRDRCRAAALLASLVLLGAGASLAQTQAEKPKAAITLDELMRQVAAQKALIEEQKKLIEAQQAKLQKQDEALEAQRKQLELLEQQLLSLQRRVEEIQGELPSAEFKKAVEERLAKVEKTSEKIPELPEDVVSAGDFPGSIRIPGTDAAIKFGGRIRTAGVFTLGPLGSEDRFLTNSIPVSGTPEAGKGKRTTFSANTSRFNIELRTPTGAAQMRAFIEGDFFGVDGNENRTTFRLRHAYAQYKGFIVGQTWSTFSDPETDIEDLDFEGISSENVIRQAQIRYWWRPREHLRMAFAAETPAVSISGGQGVNIVPDLVSRAIWEDFREGAHLQGAVVLRQIRGETAALPGEVASANGWGASLSGVLPFKVGKLEDRLVFQINGGEGNARYVNDLNSLGGQDAVFHPATGELEALPTFGFYVGLEHHWWNHWEKTREMQLRSSLIWSMVNVDNFDFQTDDAYHRTDRYSLNLVFSPIPRIDVGVQYIYGTRENKNGARGDSSQVQFVAIFRF